MLVAGDGTLVGRLCPCKRLSAAFRAVHVAISTPNVSIACDINGSGDYDRIAVSIHTNQTFGSQLERKEFSKRLDMRMKVAYQRIECQQCQVFSPPYLQPKMPSVRHAAPINHPHVAPVVPSNQGVDSEAGRLGIRTTNTIQMATKEWEGGTMELDQMFDRLSRDQVGRLPKYPMPELLLKAMAKRNVSLFEHQVQGIRWLIHQERDEFPSYFKQQGNSWRCLITKCSMNHRPRPVRGGILADDMGLGRFTQVLV